MKKIAIVILSLLLAIVFAGCGTYTPESSGGHFSDHNSGNTNKNPGGGNNDEDPDDDSEGYTFTVTLVGAPDELPEDMKAVWTNKREEYSAPFVDGVATVTGLNGEYRVTLNKLPSVKTSAGTTQYTYDSNGYDADNNNRDVRIRLQKIITTSRYTRLEPHNEEAAVNFYNINQYGTYRATIRSATEAIGFMFEPSENGVFYITSMCDVTANNINPILKLYFGSKVYCQFIEEIDDGGSSNTFTKNFRQATNFADENTGGGVSLFAIRAEVNGGVEYPVTVDFTLSREGDYELEDLTGEPVYADGPYATPEQQNPGGSWRYIYEDNTTVSGGNTYYIQDETKVVFNEADGFYHVGTVDGPLLYAKLIKDCQVFVTVEMESWVNLGFYWNRTLYPGGKVSLIWNGYDYSYMINEGYAAYCTKDNGGSHPNNGGAHPVNKQIKEFLQGYASRQMLFRDGEGWAEDYKMNANNFTNPNGLRLQSDENSMWLFACGYHI